MELKLPMWMMILINIEDNKNIAYITKKVDITYFYGVKIIKVLQKNEIIKLTKIGRDLLINITDKGKQIQENIKQVYFKI